MRRPLNVAAARLGLSVFRQKVKVRVADQYEAVENSSAAGLGGSYSKKSQGASVQRVTVAFKVARSAVSSSTFL